MDEKPHFITALNVANGNFSYVENPMEDKAFRDIEQFTPLHEIILEYGNTKYEMNMEPILEDETDTTIRVTTYSPILYIPSAIGINIARLFGGSIVDVILAGRIANLIVFSIMLIIIFKLLPFKKDTFYCLYLLPQAVALAASYSMDGLTIGVVGIFIAYVLKLYKQNEGVINLKQYVTLLLLFGISLLTKSGVYLGICVIVFILPIIKSIRQNKKILIVLLLLLILAGVLGLYRFNDLANSTEGDPRVKLANPKEQMRFLLSDYTNIIIVYSNCMQGTLFNLEYYEGFNLQEFTGDIYRIVGFVLIIFILYTAITDGSYTFKKKEKALMCLAFGATFLIGTFALYLFYTPVRVLTVLGYQDRYLIPILPLVLIGINSKKIDTKYNEEETYSKMAMSLGILTFVDIISKIIFVLE